MPAVTMLFAIQKKWQQLNNNVLYTKKRSTAVPLEASNIVGLLHRCLSIYLGNH